MNEIERDLAASIREQKSTGSGAYHKAPSKQGPRSAVKTPVDTMPAKERREYTKPGALVLDNMAQPVKWVVYKQLSEDAKRERLRYWASHYGIWSAVKMSRPLGCSQLTVRKEFERLGIGAALKHIASELAPEEAQAAAENYNALKLAQEGTETRETETDTRNDRYTPYRGENRPLVSIEWDGKDGVDIRQVGRMIAEVPDGRYTLRLMLEAV